jgi:hypothetical protein
MALAGESGSDKQKRRLREYIALKLTVTSLRNKGSLQSSRYLLILYEVETSDLQSSTALYTLP